MSTTNGKNLDSYYQYVQDSGKLPTSLHAKRWSMAVLKTLGFNLDGRTKKQLGGQLPQELAGDLKRIFWLVHFRDSTLSKLEFLNQVSRRGGNTDWQYAQVPTRAVFHAVKQIVDQDTVNRVTNALSPEVSDLWKNA